LQSSFFGLAFW